MNYDFQLTDAMLFHLEVEQSKSRDKTEDLSNFTKTVGAIRDSLSAIRSLKLAKGADGVSLK